MSIPRGLSENEAAAWARLAATVTPIEGREVPDPPRPGAADRKAAVGAQARRHQPPPPAIPAPNKPAPNKPAPNNSADAVSRRHPGRSGSAGLDSHWERRLKTGTLVPDFTLDLHGHTLDTAYDRLMSGLDQARAMEARVVLLIAGRPRPVDPADRASRRGAIRSKILDWLAASRHEGSIAAVRRAHIRHGGAGALYLVLKRQR